jgi:hypothetical protein
MDDVRVFISIYRRFYIWHYDLLASLTCSSRVGTFLLSSANIVLISHLTPLTMADNEVYRASTFAPVNIAVIK